MYKNTRTPLRVDILWKKGFILTPFNFVLLIGAVQVNGYFLLTHYETEVTNGNELKSLLGRGDFIRRVPDQDPLLLPIEAMSQPEGVSGVIGNV